MRILHVHKYFHAEDGASRYMVELMRLQEAAGHAVAPFSMHDPRNLPTPWSEYFVSSLDTSRVRSGLGALAQFGRALWSREAQQKMEQVVTAFSPDVVHLHNIYNHLSPSILRVCLRHRIPVVMTVHDYALISANYALWTGDDFMTPQSRGFLPTIATRFAKGSYLASAALTIIHGLHRVLGAYRPIEHYFVFSDFMKQELLHFGVPNKKLVHLFPFSAPLLEDEMLPISRKRSGVLFAGRLELYKGTNLLIEAAKMLPEVTFTFAGKGSETERIVQAAKDLPNVRYLGFLRGRAIWQQMVAAQVVAVPSVWAEPFGLVALEALALGTPILVSDRGALPELVPDKRFGRIFAANNSQDLVQQLKKC